MDRAVATAARGRRRHRPPGDSGARAWSCSSWAVPRKRWMPQAGPCRRSRMKDPNDGHVLAYSRIVLARLLSETGRPDAAEPEARAAMAGSSAGAAATRSVPTLNAKWDAPGASGPDDGREGRTSAACRYIGPGVMPTPARFSPSTACSPVPRRLTAADEGNCGVAHVAQPEAVVPSTYAPVRRDLWCDLHLHDRFGRRARTIGQRGSWASIWSCRSSTAGWPATSTSTTPPRPHRCARCSTRSCDSCPYYSSVHRGAGGKSRVSTAAYDEAHHTIARFVGANAATNAVIFGKNATEAINKLSYRYPLTEDAIVLSTVMEHHSNDLPWRRRARVVRAAVTTDGRLDKDNLNGCSRPTADAWRSSP